MGKGFPHNEADRKQKGRKRLIIDYLEFLDLQLAKCFKNVSCFEAERMAIAYGAGTLSAACRRGYHP